MTTAILVALGSYHHRLYLQNLSKMPISCYQRASGFHAAGSNPNIIDRDLGTLFNQRQINNPIFAGNVMVDINDFNLQFSDKFLEFIFIEPLTAAFHKAVAQFTKND